MEYFKPNLNGNKKISFKMPLKPQNILNGKIKNTTKSIKMDFPMYFSP